MKRLRVIDQLRKLFPDGVWIYDQHTFQWVDTKGGHNVCKVSQHAPIYDGDDDRFVTRYMLDYPTGRYLDEIRGGGVHSSDGLRLE